MHLSVFCTLLLTNESDDQYTENHLEPLWNEHKWSRLLLTTFQSHFNKTFSNKILYSIKMHLFVVDIFMLTNESDDQYTENHFEPLWNECKWSRLLFKT